MRMTDRNALGIVVHIANDPELRKSYDYLAHYVFKGLYVYKYMGKSLFQVIEDAGGWQEFCKKEIFWAVDFVEPPTSEMLDRLARCAVQYLAYLVALDMLVEKFTDQTIYQDADKSIMLTNGEHSVDNSRVELNFVIRWDAKTGGTITMYISPDTGNFIPEKNVLDQRITVDTLNAKDSSSYNRKRVRLKDLTKATLVEILKDAGWLDLKV